MVEPKKFAKRILFLLLLLFAASSFALTIYLGIFQVNTAISMKRLAVSAAGGIALALLSFWVIQKASKKTKLSGSLFWKILFLSIVSCLVYVILFTMPQNYLFAPESSFDITIHRTSLAANGSTRLTYLDSGLEYISPRYIKFTPSISDASGGEISELVFDTQGDSGFSWSGRAWRKITIVIESSQPVEITVSYGGGISEYQLGDGRELTIHLPVLSNSYYVFLSILSFTSYLICFFLIYMVGSLILKSWAEQKNMPDSPPFFFIKIINGFVLVLFGGIIGTIIYLGFQNRLYSDDYCYIINLQKLGWWKAISYYMDANNGRYASHVFNLLGFEFPKLNNLLGPITAFFLIGGSLFMFFEELLRQYDRKTRVIKSILFVLTLVGSIFLVTPFLYESFIWNLHSIIASGGFAFFVVSCALFLKTFRHQGNKMQMVGITLFFFAWGLLGAGFHEITTMLNIVISFVLLLIFLIKKDLLVRKRPLIYLLAYLLSNIVGLVILLKAPASSAGISHSLTLDLAAVFFTFLKMVRENTSLILTSNGFLALSLIPVIFLGGFWWGRMLPQPLSWIRIPLTFLQKITLVTSPLLFYFAAFIPLAFLGGYFPTRTLAMPICFSLLALFLSGLIFGNARHDFSIPNRVLAGLLAATLVITSIHLILFMPGYISEVLSHKSEWDAREAQIIRAATDGKKELDIYPYRHPLGTDLSTTNNLWLNACENDYYGIDLIIHDQ
jgi:hypothetical protein